MEVNMATKNGPKALQKGRKTSMRRGDAREGNENGTLIRATKRVRIGNTIATSSGWYTLANLRVHNPELDTMHGHRACLVPGDYTAAQWDDLVDTMISSRNKRKKRNNRKRIVLERKVTKRDERSMTSLLRLYTLDWRPAFTQHAAFAGLFFHATDIDMPNQPLEERCVLNIELCGTRRKTTGKMTPEGFSGDPGGRLILPDINRLRTGKSTIKSLNKHRYSLTCTRSFERVLKEIVKRKGVNWLGFCRVQELLLSLPKLGNTSSTDSGDVKANATEAKGGQTTPAVRVCTFELWDHKNGDVDVSKSDNGQSKRDSSNPISSEPILVAAEIGLLVGSCYTSLSAFADTQVYPRCDRVHIQGTLLWLAEKGVKLFDVGTTADYMETQFGYSRVTRRTFIDLWRQNRAKQLTKSMNGICGEELTRDRLKELLRANRAKHVV